MLWKHSFALAAFLALLSKSTLAFPQSDAPASEPGSKAFSGEPVDVFSAGQDGYKVFRIPAIIRSTNGDLLAFCEARQGGDASEIDLVMKRSSDTGKTWGPLHIVSDSQQFAPRINDPSVEITVGNPAPVVDLLSEQHAGRIWLPFTVENDLVFVTFSDDHGRSWVKPREITDDVKRPGWGWYATGPVHAIQIGTGPFRGRLVVPCDHRLGGHGEDKGPLGAHAILSDDHGVSWRLGAVDATYDDGLNANETSVVELDEGVLYFNTRDQNGDAPGTRGEAWSHDGGESFDSRSGEWAAFRPASATLDPPVVQSSLLRTLNGWILFCGPDDDGPTGPGRSDLRLRYSTDQAQSFRDGPLLHVGPAAYSDLVNLSPQQIGVLFECGSRSPYECIRFRMVSLQSMRP